MVGRTKSSKINLFESVGPGQGVLYSHIVYLCVKFPVGIRPAADSNCIRIRSVRLPQFGAFWRSADFGFMKALPYVAYFAYCSLRPIQKGV